MIFVLLDNYPLEKFLNEKVYFFFFIYFPFLNIFVSSIDMSFHLV